VRSLNKLRNGNRRNQIVFSIGSVLVLFVISTLYGLIQMNRFGNEMKAITEYHIPLTKMMTKVDSYQLEQTVFFERALSISETMSAEVQGRDSFNAALQEYNDYVVKAENEIDKGVAMVENAVHAADTEHDRKFFSDMAEHLTKVQQRHRAIDQHAQDFHSISWRWRPKQSQLVNRSGRAGTNPFHSSFLSISHESRGIDQTCGAKCATLGRTGISLDACSYSVCF
jgi:hypothetical protein